MVRLLILLFVSAPAVAQTGLGFGGVVGSGGPDGGTPEFLMAVTGGGAVATGPVLFTADLEVGVATRTTGGDYAFDFDDRTYDPFGFNEVPCRRLGSGRDVPRTLCEDSRAVAALSADASLLVPGVRGLSVGAGYRVGFQPTPYLTAGYTFGDSPAEGVRFEGVMSQRMMGAGASVLFGL